MGSSTGLDAESLGRLRADLPSVFFVTSADGGGDDPPWPARAVHPDDEPNLLAAWLRTRAKGEPARLRARLREDEGFYARCEVRAVPLRTNTGDVVGWIASKVALNRESFTRTPRVAELFRAICKTAADVIFVKDVEGRYLFVNPTWARVLGTDAESITGTTDAHWFAADVAVRLGEEEARVLAARAATRSDHELVVGGAARLFSFARAPYVDDDGHIAGVVGIARDVTDMRRELQAVREERDMFATIANVVPGAFASFRIRPDGTLSMPFATLAIMDIFGVTPDELERDPLIPQRLTHPDDRPRVEAALAHSAQTLAPLRCEYRVAHPTRGELWVEVVAGPTREPDGSTLWHGITLDVTERKRVERELIETSSLIEAIARTAPGALYSFRRDAEGVDSFPYLGPGAGDLLGVSTEELRSYAWRAVHNVAEDDAGLLRRSVDESARTLSPWRAEFRVHHPGRGVVWVEGHSTPRRLDDGSIVWHGILLDVTERRRTDDVVRAERDRFTVLSETVPGTIYTYRLERGRIEFLFVGGSIVELTGLTPDAIRADPMALGRLVHPDDGASLRQRFMNRDGGTEPRREEFRIIHPKLGEVWIEGRSRPVRAPDGSIVWHGILLDLTERRRSEEKLRASESTLRAIVETVPDTLVLMDREGRIQFINRLTDGYRMEDVVGSSALDFIVPAMRAEIARTMDLVFQQGTVQTYEGAVEGPGQTLWFHTRVGPVLQDDRVVALTLASTDITSRRHIEDALRASEERYRKLIELLPDAVFVHINQRLTYCNEAFVRLMRAGSRDELLGVTPHQVVHADHHALLGKRLGHMRDTRQAVPPVEMSIVALDGTRRAVSAVAAPIFTSGEELAIVVVLHDLTERKKLEEQFRQAHKMEAFGQLAGGVAHDFNNLLTVILSEASLLLTEARDGAAGADSLHEIRKAGERAAELTRQLLAFSRKTVLEPKVLDLNVVVRDTESMLRRIIGEDVQLETTLAPNLRRVHVDPGQIVQVVINLAVNARDAMPRGGALSISTSNVDLDERRAEALGVSPGPYVKLAVRDRGTGMTPDVLARVFQPFFTTKPVGEGTGLGLAVVHGIVVQSGGAIDVDTEVGRGTLWDIFLPQARSISASRIAAVAGPAPAGGAILVVEDDEALRRLARRILTSRGHTVRVARNGAEALEILDREGERFDLVVTDVVMPEMDGRELGDRIARVAPRLKVLYVSGYTDDMLVRRGLSREEVDFLHKPYTVATLGAAVDRVLAR